MPQTEKQNDQQKEDLHELMGEEPPSEGMWTWRLLLLGITAIWGSNFVVTKSALDALGNAADDGSLFLASRFAVSAVLLAPVLASNRPSPSVILAGASVGGLCVLGYAAQSIALGLGTSASTAAFMCTLQAVVVAVAAGRKGPVPARTWLAVAIAVLGIGCLEVLPSILAGSSEASSYEFCIGDLVALGQPLGFGLSYVVLEEVMNEHPEDELAISALQCVVIAAASLAAASASFGSGALDANALAAPWALPWEHMLPSAAGEAAAATPLGSWTVTAGIVYGGAVATALTIWLQAACFKRLPSMDASIILASEPVWAAIGAALFLGEGFGIAQGLGGSLILLAILLQEGLIPGFDAKEAE